MSLILFIVGVCVLLGGWNYKRLFPDEPEPVNRHREGRKKFPPDFGLTGGRVGGRMGV
jgi:hypothetical protein